MTYDEAADAVDILLEEIRQDDGMTVLPNAEDILNAIGYRQMQERINQLSYVDEAYDRLQGMHADLLDTAEKLKKERDAARALADQLAEALKDSGADGHPAHTYKHTACGLCMEEAALDAWEERDWK